MKLYDLTSEKYVHISFLYPSIVEISRPLCIIAYAFAITEYQINLWALLHVHIRAFIIMNANGWNRTHTA